MEDNFKIHHFMNIFKIEPYTLTLVNVYNNTFKILFMWDGVNKEDIIQIDNLNIITLQHIGSVIDCKIIDGKDLTNDYTFTIENDVEGYSRLYKEFVNCINDYTECEHCRQVFRMCSRNQKKYTPICGDCLIQQDIIKNIESYPKYVAPDNCSICLEPLFPNYTRKMFCNHVFHPRCIENLQNKGHYQCPLCREAI